MHAARPVDLRIPNAIACIYELIMRAPLGPLPPNLQDTTILLAIPRSERPWVGIPATPSTTLHRLALFSAFRSSEARNCIGFLCEKVI